MRRVPSFFVALLVFSAGANPAAAGIYRVYSPRDGIETPGRTPLPFRAFREITIKFLQIGNDQLKGNQNREAYLKAAQQLQGKLRAGTITIDERVTLSEYLLRLRRFEEAVEVLTPAAAQERRNFMVFANLASAHQLAGRLDRAINYLQQAKDVWPTEWKGFTKEQLRFFQLAEKYHLRLLRLRYAESIRQGQQRKSAEGLDNLFGDERGPIRFVGESGSYEPGKIDPREQARLPAEALAIVQQLLIWFPEDTRLLWLLGELYNAQGDLNSAFLLLDDCVWNRHYSDSELRQHWRIVQEAKPKGEQLALDSQSTNAATPESPWLPDTRQIVIVGGLAGLAVAGLAYLQIREVRKRRKA
jgi:tetratricopeptide (TPR) repeat protein